MTVKFVECAGDIASIEELLSKYDFLWKLLSFNVEFKFANSIEESLNMTVKYYDAKKQHAHRGKETLQHSLSSTVGA